MLESYVPKSRDEAAALIFMKKALERHGSPEAITTDGLRSCLAAMNDIGNANANANAPDRLRDHHHRRPPGGQSRS